MRNPDPDLSGRVPDDLLPLLTDHALHLAADPAGAIAIRTADGDALVWASDEAGLMDGLVDGAAYDHLVGPWVSVIYADLRHPALVHQLVNGLTGGAENCGAEIVRHDGRLALRPGPDADVQPLPDRIPVYLCASGDGEVIALTEEEYRDSLDGA